MRIYLTFICSILLGTALYGQQKPTLHFLNFADNVKYRVQTDISDYCVQDLRIVRELLGEVAKRCEFNIKDYNKSNEFSSKALKNALYNLAKTPIGKNDIVFFFYSGHGGRSIDTDENINPYPVMLFNLEQEEKYKYSLLVVHNLLKKAEARLLITMGDLCNSYTKMLSSENHLLPLGAGQKSSLNEKLIKLFKKAKGNFIITSSKPGQTSACVPGNNGEALGSVFTTSFQYVFVNYIHNAPIEEITWSNILKQAKETCNENSKAYINKSQIPVYNIDISYSN